MSVQIPFKDLAREMERGRTTNGYDVLVAYSSTKLNAFLQARAGQLRLEPVHFEAEGCDRNGSFTLIVHLELSGPVLEFKEQNVYLTFDVSGYTKYTDKEKKDCLPQKLQIVLNTELCHIAGRVDETGQFQATTNAHGQPVDSKPSGEKVVLGPKDNSARGVCIDMSRVKANFIAKDDAGDDAKKMVKELNAVRTNIESHFMEASSVEYYLAGASRKSESHDLVPETFNFSISAGEDEEAALCLWIGVKGGLNNSSKDPNFHPGDYARSPIPTGSTASIVIHHDLLWKKFLLENLKKTCQELTAESSTSEDAYRAECDLNFSDYYQPREEFGETIGSLINPIRHQRTRSEIRFSAKRKEKEEEEEKEGKEGKKGEEKKEKVKKGATVSIHRGVATSSSHAAAIVYKSDTQIIKWSEYYDQDASWGTVEATFEWAMRGKWSNGVNDGANPNTISLDWENDKEWSISGRVTSSNKAMGRLGGFQEFLTTSKSSYVPPNVLKTDVPAPKIDMSVWDSLNYFLTTNLLYPGSQMFKAHEIGKQDSKGLAVPFDLILTGDLNTTAQ